MAGGLGRRSSRRSDGRRAVFVGAQAEADLNGLGWRVAGVVCVAFKFQPRSVADGRGLWAVGAGAGAGRRAALTPPCVSPVLPSARSTHSINAGSPPSQRQAKRLLGQIVDRCRNGPGFHNDVDGSSTIQELLIPASKVGLVIGKGGETIKQLQVCVRPSRAAPEPASPSSTCPRPGLVWALPCPPPPTLLDGDYGQARCRSDARPSGPRELAAASVAGKPLQDRFSRPVTTPQIKILGPEPGALSQQHSPS